MSICQKVIDLQANYATKAQEAVERHNKKESWDSIAKSYGFDKDCFTKWLAKNGYYRRRAPTNYKALPPDILETAYNEYTTIGTPITQLAKRLHVARKKLSQELKLQYGIEILHDGKKAIDDHFFDVINTEEKAYWLGFMYADGYVSHDNYIEFCLQDIDKESVVRFKNALHSKHKVAAKSTTCNGKTFLNWRISIKSPIMAQALIRHGCMQNKSYIIQFPIDLQPNLMSHFIRGYFDGDGCVYGSKRGARDRISVSFVSASYSFITALKDFLEDALCITSSLCKIKNKDNWALHIAHTGSHLFYRYIYKDSTEQTRMLRKYDKYTDLINTLPLRVERRKKTLSNKSGIKLEGSPT